MATEYVSHHFDQVGSTQDEARRLFSGLPVMVTATGQAQGRGRGGAAWLNAPRAVAASVAFRPAWPQESLPVLTLLAGTAARRALGDELGLKWPNDLVRETGDKVAGLLAERSDDLVVVGLGANLYWPDPPEGVAALWPDDPGADAPPKIAELWAGLLLASTAGGPGNWDRAAYRSNCVTLGTDVVWAEGGRGRALDIDEEGGLVVETAGGRITLRSGQVSEVRPATVDGKGE